MLRLEAGETLFGAKQRFFLIERSNLQHEREEKRGKTAPKNWDGSIVAGAAFHDELYQRRSLKLVYE